MTDLVDPNEIEKIFGIPRHAAEHLLHFQKGTVYIMHSQECINTGIDLRECVYSVALDEGTLGWVRHDGLVIADLDDFE